MISNELLIYAAIGIVFLGVFALALSGILISKGTRIK